MFRCSFVFAVACVKSTEDGALPNNLHKSQDWLLPLDVTTLVADNCDLSSKHAMSLTSTVLRKASEPMLAQIKLQKARHSDHMVLHLESIVPMYRRNGYKIPEFDARREIMHYLNGFHGHIEWLTSYLDNEGLAEYDTTMDFVEHFRLSHSLCGLWIMIKFVRDI